MKSSAAAKPSGMYLIRMSRCRRNLPPELEALTDRPIDFSDILPQHPDELDHGEPLATPAQ